MGRAVQEQRHVGGVAEAAVLRADTQSNDHQATSLAYWRKQLNNLQTLPLPIDHQHPAVSTSLGNTHPVTFSRELRKKLEALSRSEGTELSTVLLSGFAVLLQRYTAVDDIAIATLHLTRPRGEAADLLGRFSKLLVLRNDLSGDPTFVELLRRARDTIRCALANADAPFDEIAKSVLPNRDAVLNSLSQVLFSFETPLPAPDGWRILVNSPEVDIGTSRSELSLELKDLGSSITGRLRYCSDLFNPDTISRMSGHLTTLMEGVAAAPESRISTLPLLTKEEQQQLLEWNDTRVECPTGLLLHDLFMEQVERTPAAIAVAAGDRKLDYRELDRRSTQLAAYLRKIGIGIEAPIGLFVEPSLEMIVGILAVLKAGGTCVPLDPTYPADRLAYAMADTQLGLLLTQAHVLSLLPPHTASTLCLDSDWAQVEGQGGDYVPVRSAPEKLAYLIYTSGSTGKPKGVQIEHRNLVHSTQARAIYYGSAAPRFLLLSSFAFDSSLAAIFGTLSLGGMVVLTPGPVKENLTQLGELMERHRITYTLGVPTLYNLILDQAGPGQLEDLRAVILGGETCPPELVDRHYKVVPWATLFNEYGPTEAAVWSTVHMCDPEDSEKIVPIGRPIPNARVYVLDPHLNQLPVGVPGELCIGRPGVVRGYLNRPEETAKSFVQDPFSDSANARLYKSGDVVRYRPDGNLEMLGRFDHQVKIRGFRVELEEIESVIREFDGIRQAVVGVHEEGKGDPRLIAYVVPDSPSPVDIEDLRSFISRKLPEAMVPSLYVTLEALPLTPNGKVNRHALPAPLKAIRTSEHVPPKNELESGLIEIWRRVLDRDEIGVTDNFFDLGGNSVLIAKVLLGIEQRFQKRLSVASIFQAPTIRQLAEALEDRTYTFSHPGVVPLQPKGSRPPLFWVDGGPMFMHIADLLGPDQPVLGLRIPAVEAVRFRIPGRIEDGAGELVRYVREVQPTGPYYLAGLCIDALVAYEMARMLTADGRQVALLALFDAPGPEICGPPLKPGVASARAKSKIEALLAELWNGGVSGLPGFAQRRTSAIARRLKMLRWRLQQAVGLQINRNSLLNDPDAIEQPSSYFSKPRPYAGPVVFLQSDDWASVDPGWKQLISGDKQVYRVAGGHLSMFEEAKVASAAACLQDCLSRSQAAQLAEPQRQRQRSIS